MTRKVLTDVCPNCGAQVTFIFDDDKTSPILDPRIKDLVDKYLAEKDEKEE